MVGECDWTSHLSSYVAIYELAKLAIAKAASVNA